ncbi:hypothetical protein APHAL10511_003336 [Amanita phalloides]|nr:hypothetical protein APHAL10511_003336 [Amanita phalloides]
MPRRHRRCFVVTLTVLCGFAIYFFPNPTQKHVYLSNGLLQVNPDAPNPIYELIKTNKARWADRLTRASQTLPEAIAEYMRRYGRPPPRGFDIWFNWAKSHHVQLLDDYESIHRGLEPFWGISPSDFRMIQADQELTTDTFTVAKNSSYNPTYLARASFSDPDTWQQRALLRGLDEILDLLEPIDDLLPNFRMIFSPHDNPNLLTNYEIRQAHIDAARSGNYVNISVFPPPSSIGFRATCAPGSPARPYDALDIPIDRSTHPPPRTSPKTFIHNHLHAMDPCMHPYLFHHHGQYVAHDIAPFPLQPHLALQFAYCITPVFHDVAPPSFIAYVNDSYPRHNDLPWDEKLDERIMWRGSNTGMIFSEDTRWQWSQRARLVNMTTQLDGSENVLLPASRNAEGRRRTPIGQGTPVRRSLLNPVMTDIAFTGTPFGCEPYYCQYLSTVFPFQPKHDAGSLETGLHKYFVDVDGHGWSSRFKRLITSNALVFKATAYPEWWLDRIQPWVHYVPIQVDYSDLYDALVFFRGGFEVGGSGFEEGVIQGVDGEEEDGEERADGQRPKAVVGQDGEDELAREIASAGREWSQRFWRKEDMTAYFWRMILEIARLSGERDGRDDLEMDYYSNHRRHVRYHLPAPILEMRILNICVVLIITITSVAKIQSTHGIYNLVERRMPGLKHTFTFIIVNPTDPYQLQNDRYTVSTDVWGQITVKGSSASALATGLHGYLTDIAHININWNSPSQLDIDPRSLPRVFDPFSGTSVVPWRYYFNPVMLSYTAAFWSWEDWEAQLDWMVLRGVNLPLALVGTEKILVEIFREIGLTDDEILSFLSGPAFQAWNRFGNIQGSWGAIATPFSWIEDQFSLQKKILGRMVELGMTPVLPSFAGYVPSGIKRIFPNITFTRGSAFVNLAPIYTSDTRLDPVEPLFAQLQQSFIAKQMQAHGNISSIYALDLFSENNPSSGDLSYLHNATYNVLQSLKAGNSAAIWLTQGWLFYNNQTFWTPERVQAYLSGVESPEDMLILDLWSESHPQWQRVNSYYGKRWIWCQGHDFGTNINLYGQITNITVNSIEALAASSNLIGFGMTPEGQETNEIMYDLLLDQAWSKAPINTRSYFHNWVTSRYSESSSIPSDVYAAWETLRTTVYNNIVNLTIVAAVPKSILELAPGTTVFVGGTDRHSRIIPYDPAVVIKAWNLMYNASKAEEGTLWQDPSFQYDMVDFTRQVLANAFANPIYADLLECYFHSSCNGSTVSALGQKLLGILSAIDTVLLSHRRFLLSTFIAAARSEAGSNTTVANFFESNARNQITLWYPKAESSVNDYASKTWGGLVSSYYMARWNIFVNYIVATGSADYNYTALNARVYQFSQNWQNERWGTNPGEPNGTVGSPKEVIAAVYANWTAIFSGY